MPTTTKKAEEWAGGTAGERERETSNGKERHRSKMEEGSVYRSGPVT